MMTVAQDSWALNLPDYWALPTRKLRELRSDYERTLRITSEQAYYTAALQAVIVELRHRGIEHC